MPVYGCLVDDHVDHLGECSHPLCVPGLGLTWCFKNKIEKSFSRNKNIHFAVWQVGEESEAQERQEKERITKKLDEMVSAGVAIGQQREQLVDKLLDSRNPLCAPWVGAMNDG
jgi:hypothetical protein